MKILYIFLLTRLIYSINAQERLESLQKCTVDAECKPNSFCFNNDLYKKGNCKCLDNYLLWRNGLEYECLLPAYYNEPCQRSTQCKIRLGSLGACTSDGVCGCEEGAHYYDGNCHKTVGLSDICKDDNNCRAIDKNNTFCTNGRCACRQLYHVSEDGICIPTSHLGRVCTQDESCISMDARCSNGICKCRSGYVAANDMHKCLKAATNFNEPCEQLSQCDAYLHGSICIKGKCSCQSGNHPNGISCYKTVRIGDICNSDKECQLTYDYAYYVKCINNICRCVEGPDNNLYECIPKNSHNVIKISYLIVGFCLVILRI